ncbi:hypothetical protein D9756_000097 [Leucocoprinus leucothites]|uniref:Transcription initiation factor TFIID subunit 4 n=1 Tax=Leucocoprinus leucothites TaxID=201217 RepID=A0A8H5GEQ4_9AGAR|nr:hypothetical protein D9756_000097 [Leucoagaricus leucothites]
MSRGHVSPCFLLAMSTMKTEETKPATPVAAAPVPAPTTTPAPATPAPTATAPAPTYATAPWATAGATHATTIPYQHYQAYSSHYPQAAYGHYQYATPLTAQTMQAQLARPAATTTPVPNTATTTTTTAANDTAADTTDIATLNDALGSAGVNLEAEAESLQRSHDQHQPYRPYEDRTRKQAIKPSFDTIHLGNKMRTIGTSHKVTRIPDDAINYIALALRARLQDLITNMIAASHHRTDTQFDRPASFYSDNTPMWKISLRSDVAKQLAVLEKVEKDEEMKVRRERKERAEMTAAHAAALAAQANGAAAASGASGDTSSVGGGMEEEGGAKKKRKKDGPGVTARNMSEDVRKKMSNAVATQAAGLGGKYAWMNAASASSPAAKPKPAATAATPSAGASTSTATPAATTTGGATTSTASSSTMATTTATTGTSGTGAGSSSWARPYVPTKKSMSATPAQMSAEEDTRTTVTMRDAIFVVEKERGHGGGRGAARGFI